MKQSIKTLNNDFKYSNNETGQYYENVTIDSLNNNFGSKTNKLDTTITVNVPSLFNINTIFIHLYFYLGLFNILLIIASIINNDFKYFGIILILIFSLLFTTLITKSKLIIEEEIIIFKDKVIELDDIVNINKGKSFNLYNYVDIFVKGRFKPIRIFLKNEDDANNICKLNYF